MTPLTFLHAGWLLIDYSSAVRNAAPSRQIPLIMFLKLDSNATGLQDVVAGYKDEEAIATSKSNILAERREVTCFFIYTSFSDMFSVNAMKVLDRRSCFNNHCMVAYGQPTWRLVQQLRVYLSWGWTSITTPMSLPHLHCTLMTACKNSNVTQSLDSLQFHSHAFLTVYQSKVGP
jgi:hypothetical protein